MEVFYFRVLGHEMGHYLVDRRLRPVRTAAGPWRAADIDAKLPPGGDRSDRHRVKQVEGAARIHHLDGWTAVAFWDRSGDSRSNSNSAFIIEGTHDFDAAIAIAREAFPTVFFRLRAAVALASEET